jgi:hypothetical protein
VNLTELGETIGVEFGTLLDNESLLSQGLRQTIEDLPDFFREQLETPLSAIETATSEADAREAIADLEKITGDLPIGIRNMLAPFLESIDYATHNEIAEAFFQDMTWGVSSVISWLESIDGHLNGDGIEGMAVGGWAMNPGVRMLAEEGPELVLPNSVSRFFQSNGIPVSGGGSKMTDELLARAVAALERANTQRTEMSEEDRQAMNRLAEALESSQSRMASDLAMTMRQ